LKTNGNYAILNMIGVEYMKENIKNMIVGSFIFYVVTVVLLVLFNYNNVVVEIELRDSEKNILANIGTGPKKQPV
jgi:hypothetical protein